MATIVKIINGMMAGDIDSYDLFKNKVMSYIDSHYPDISRDEYEDIFENIIENIVNNGGVKSNNPCQYMHQLINSNIKKYNKALEVENNKIIELDEDMYYTEDLIFDQIYKSELIIQLREILNTLTERERAVIKYRFFGPYTLEETGKIFGVARERIRQIEAIALRKLRHPSRSKKIKDFFDDNYCGINNSYAQNISRDYYTDQINHDLKIEDERFNRTQKEIESYRKEKAREEKLLKERKRKKAEKLKNKNYEEERRKQKEIEERKKKAEAYINYLLKKLKIEEEQERKEKQKQINREKQIINNHYSMLITDYVSKLKQTADLIDEVMLNTEGDKRELYNIITNFYGISYEQYKQNIEEFYNKYRKR